VLFLSIFSYWTSNHVDRQTVLDVSKAPQFSCSASSWILLTLTTNDVPISKSREILAPRHGVTNRKTCISLVKFLYIYCFFIRSDLANCTFRDSPEVTGVTSPLPLLMIRAFQVQLFVYGPEPMFTSQQLTFTEIFELQVRVHYLCQRQLLLCG